jgi:hypothetical protein
LHVDRQPADGQRLGQGLLHAFDHGDGGRCVAVGQQHGELIAAQPGERVSIA